MDVAIKTNYFINGGISIKWNNIINSFKNKFKIKLFKRNESDDDGSDTNTYLREWNLKDLNYDEDENNKNNEKEENKNN